MMMMDSSGTSQTKTINSISIEDIRMIKAEAFTDERFNKTTYKIRLYGHDGNMIQDVKCFRTREEALDHLAILAEQIKDWDSDIPIVTAI
jgi:ferritin-like protein